MVAGLGNPGVKYNFTRHNAGFLVVDSIVNDQGASWEKNSRLNAAIAKVFLGENRRKLVLLKPHTFMNLSGSSISKSLSYFKLPPEDLIVIHDDIDMEFGRVKTKIGGGHGGHNGIRSIVQELGSQSFARIKVGVGRPVPGSVIAVSDWVLRSFENHELAEIQVGIYEQVMKRLVELCLVAAN